LKILQNSLSLYLLQWWTTAASDARRLMASCATSAAVTSFRHLFRSSTHSLNLHFAALQLITFMNPAHDIVIYSTVLAVIWPY